MEKEFEHISSLIGKSIKKNKALNAKVSAWQAKQDVESVLGEQIMGYINKIDIKHNIIRIYTYESVLRQEVKSMEEQLLERINSLSASYQFNRILI